MASTPDIFTVARSAGVSPATVTRVVRGYDIVSAKTTAKVQRAILELGYRPKLAAQILASGKTGNLGLLMEDAGPIVTAVGGFSSPILTSFLYACAENKQRYFVEFVPAGSENFQPPHHLAGGLVDGVALAGHVSTELRNWLTEHDARYPWVSIDEPGNLCVISAADRGVEQAVRALAEMGHRRIGLMVGPQCFTSHRLTLKGFNRAVKALDIDTNQGRWISVSDAIAIEDQVAARVPFLVHCLKNEPRPTAIICHGIGARDVVMVATGLGLSVPRDLSVMALCVAAEALICTPALSAIEPAYTPMVRRAVELLRQRIAGPMEKKICEWIEPTIVQRETVAPPPDPKQG